MPKYKTEYAAYEEQLKGTVFEELSVLREKIDEFAGNNFKNDLDTLLDALFSHYTQRNDMGNFVPMTAEEYQDVRQKYQKCLSDYQNLSLDGQSEPMQRLGTALLRDTNALSGLPIDNLPPLAEVLHGAEIETIQMYTQGKTVGEMVSSREAVEYTDRNGIVHQGFFTAEEDVTHWPAKRNEADQQLVDSLKAKYPEFQKTIQAAFSDMTYRNKIRSGKQELDEYVRTAPWMRRLSAKKQAAFKNIQAELSAGLDKNYVHYILTRDNRIRPDAKLAQRSSAMSDVARVLGFSELLANSHRVIVERNGEKIEGTMMELAGPDGVDRANLQKDSPLFRVNEDDFNNPEMLKSLANLQILDYLCANTDRHSRNFFIRFDTTDPAHPKVIGVQGIDNDNSFGALKDGTKRMASAENLKVITPEMKEAVQKMTAASFEALLKDYGMDKAEIEAAAFRLDKLQNMILNGEKQEELHFEADEKGDIHLRNHENAIHIVKDDEWNKLTCKKLVAEGFMTDNIFSVVGKITNHLEQDKAETLNKSERKSGEQGLQFSQQNEKTAFENLRAALQKEYQQLKKMEKRLDEKGMYADGTNGSRQFNNMGKGVKYLVGKYESLFENLSGCESLNAKAQKHLDSFYDKIRKNRETILKFADTYIHKDKVHIFTRGKERLKVAVELNDFAQKEMQDSEKLFISQKKERQLWSQKSAYEVSAYTSNQLRSMMDKALHDNVMILKAGDPNHALGLRAMKAQKRLWNFSQMNVPAPSEDQKKQISAAELGAMEDVNILLSFVKAQNLDANVPDIKNSITPKQARSILGAVFEQEMKLVNERAPKQKDSINHVMNHPAEERERKKNPRTL